MVLFENVKSVTVLLKKGYLEEEAKTAYEKKRLRKGNTVLVWYTSGKLLLQGKTEAVSRTADEIKTLRLGKEVKAEKFRKEEGWIIGSDEALKGDTFGGLTVAAVKADENLRKKLLELGVADSKTLSDQEVLRIAEGIKKLVPCEVLNILPEQYNNDGKVTSMLNNMHREAANYLFPGVHVVDKFPGCIVGQIQEEKAESKYVEVAAASVLARAAALQQLNMLSEKAGFKIPKGSTHVKLALQELKLRKLDFQKFVKVNFSNVKEFL